MKSLLSLMSTLMLCALSCPAGAAEAKTEEAKEAEVRPVYDSSWATYAALGAQFLPDYDEEGRSSGLNKQQFFAQLTVDGRFNDKGTGAATCGFRKIIDCPVHAGVTLSLLGSPVVREANGSSVPTEFNDVARTIVSSMYAFAPWINHSVDKESGHNLGPFARVGVVSRETLGPRGDSVNWFHSLGLQYSSMRFMGYNSAAGKPPRNGVPEGYIRLAAARFEDYAGLGRKTRFVADAALRIYPAANMFLGVQGNFGKGPDEFMLVVSLVRQPEEIANLFSFGKE